MALPLIMVFLTKKWLQTQTPYSVNKLQVEEGLRKISDKLFTPIALRFGTVYGMSPRIRFDVVINMLCGLALTTNKVVLNSNGQLGDRICILMMRVKRLEDV